MNCWRCRDPGDARENIHQRPRPFQIQPKLSLSKTYNQLIMRQIVRCHIAWTFALLILLVLKWYIISLNLRQKKHRIVLVMKPKYLGMWVHSAVGIFWIVGSSKKIFRKQRRQHRAEWKSDPDVGEEEKTDNIKTTQHCKSNQAVHHQRKILMADMRPQDNYTKNLHIKSICLPSS